MACSSSLAGFTGRLVTRYLNSHRDRQTFTIALAARSHSKLQELAKDLDLNTQLRLLNLDVTNVADVETVVKSAKVVINTVGPYCLFGTPVVRYVRSRDVLRLSLICYAGHVHGTGFIISTCQVRCTSDT